MAVYIVIILISLLFSGFFSGLEIAFVSANKLRIEVEKKQEKSASGIVQVFTKNPGQYIATMLVGNNIALVIYGIFMALVLEPYIVLFVSNEALVLLIQTILSTLVILVTAEFLPKTLFRINPNNALNFFALPVMFFYVLLYPVAKVAILLSNGILKGLLKVDVKEENGNPVFGKVDLDYFINEVQESAAADDDMEVDVKMFQNALDFSNVKLRECIIPRTELVAIDVNDTIDSLREKFIETGLSKILVYKDSIDHIVGYFHVSEIFKNQKTIRSKVQPLIIVPETMPANRLLSQFIREHKSIALVVDEFGGTSGIVTIEDIIEEIFGEITDEHDTVEFVEKQLSENEFLFSGRLEIDTINEKYDLSIPESDEYETLAGYILFNYENIPQANEQIDIDQYSIRVLKVTNTKIELIRITVKNSANELQAQS
ncbi:MAG: hemolysin [Marinilabiliales bacterium]|nr:MAG: hemolysin [Marinilabiliales bacterium]